MYPDLNTFSLILLHCVFIICHISPYIFLHVSSKAQKWTFVKYYAVPIFHVNFQCQCNEMCPWRPVLKLLYWWYPIIYYYNSHLNIEDVNKSTQSLSCSDLPKWWSTCVIVSVIATRVMVPDAIIPETRTPSPKWTYHFISQNETFHQWYVMMHWQTIHSRSSNLVSDHLYIVL